MLFREQRGRREDRHLLAIGDCHVGRTQGDFGLAEADIAADEAVHRPARAHVFDHGGNRGRLIRCFLEAEAFGKGVVVTLLKAEGMALARGAAGVEVEQLGGGVAHLNGGAALGLFPLAAAQAM